MPTRRSDAAMLRHLGILLLLGCARPAPPPSNTPIAPRSKPAACIDAGCEGERCKPFVIASGQHGVSTIYANEHFVAWQLREMPSGAPIGIRARTWTSSKIVAVDAELKAAYSYSVVAAGDSLYACSDDGLARVAPFGGATRTLVAKGNCTAITTDGDRVAWATDTGTVHVLAGDKDTVVTKLDGQVWVLSLSGNTLIAHSGGCHAVISVEARTHTCRDDLPDSAAVFGNDVFLVERYVEPGPYNEKYGVQGSPMDALVHTSLVPAAPRVRLAGKQISVSGLRKIGARVYWHDGGIYDNPVVIRRATLPSGPVEDVLSPKGYSTLTAHCAVWGDDGKIVALPL
jgi:hypothetical protein